MKKARFTERQIVAILREADAELPVGDVIRKHPDVTPVSIDIVTLSRRRRISLCPVNYGLNSDLCRPEIAAI